MQYYKIIATYHENKIHFPILPLVYLQRRDRAKGYHGAEQMGRLLPILKGKRVALVVNQTSKVGETHLLDTLLAAHIQIKRYSLPNTASGVMPMPEKPSGTEKIPAREYPSCPFTVKIRNLQPHSYRT